MLNNQAARTILVASVFISTTLFVMRFFEGRNSLASDDEISPPVSIQVADEPRPTIVRPNDDWMQTHRKQAERVTTQTTLESDHEDTAFLTPPVSLDSSDSGTLRR
ncbi:MAG: hypothetical protein GY768_06600 [Planctomycetaceae bacterium]|nr:hypothetical protein [Planctomycetaceae bacterium]